jgi:hypothetical protein
LALRSLVLYHINWYISTGRGWLKREPLWERTAARRTAPQAQLGFWEQ